MPEEDRGSQSTDFVGRDLTGARFLKTQLNGARFRMCDLSGVVMNDLSLSGASIDGCEIDGLLINGVDIAPLVEAELSRREPARALRRSTDPAGLLAAWTALEASWAALYDRVAAMPEGSVDISVADEWSFSETLRHLIFATDAWLGAVRGDKNPFHPWGLPFTEFADFVGRPPSDIGIDPNARPSYRDVLDLRADRVARVREYLQHVTPERLDEQVEGPIWEEGEHLAVLRCLWVILNEECEHLRFAQRDLGLIEAAGADYSGG